MLIINHSLKSIHNLGIAILKCFIIRDMRNETHLPIQAGNESYLQYNNCQNTVEYNCGTEPSCKYFRMKWRKYIYVTFGKLNVSRYLISLAILKRHRDKKYS